MLRLFASEQNLFYPIGVGGDIALCCIQCAISVQNSYRTFGLATFKS